MLWGDPKIVAERLAGKVKDLSFEIDIMTPSALGPRHFRLHHGSDDQAPSFKLVADYKVDPDKLPIFHAEFRGVDLRVFRPRQQRDAPAVSDDQGEEGVGGPESIIRARLAGGLPSRAG